MKALDFIAGLNPVAVSGFVLLLIGVWGALSRPNIFKIAVAFSVLETGVNLIILSVGYMRGRTAPILDSAAEAATAVQRMVDPIPQALVLTAIVIGLAVTALMLSYAIRMRSGGGGGSIDTYGEHKW